MTKRGEVWALLLARQGEWVTRGEIEQVGGMESMRRLREVREVAVSQGFTFEQQRSAGLLEYRLMPITRQRELRDPWVCTKCGAHPATDPQPTTDTQDRWRTGWCVPCGNKKAIFKKETR